MNNIKLKTMNIVHDNCNGDMKNFNTHKANYKTLIQEIDENLQTIKNNPQDLSAYTHVGKLYSCQGKPQNAVLILEQGIQNMSSSSDRHFLQQQLDLSQAQLERRIDFISHCPNEIVYTIINELDQKTNIQCLNVARTWRRKFLDYSGAWKELNLEGCTFKPRKLAQLLRIIAMNIQVLNIHAETEKLSKYFVTLFKNNKFSNLRTLYIAEQVDVANSPEINPVKRFFNALPLVSISLTTLDLTFTSIHHQHTKVSLIRILSICPELQTLKIAARVLGCEDEKPKYINYRGVIGRFGQTIYKPGKYHGIYKSLIRLEIKCDTASYWTMLNSLKETFHCTPNLKYLGYFCKPVIGDDMMMISGQCSTWVIDDIDKTCFDLEKIDMGLVSYNPDRDRQAMMMLDNNNNSNENDGYDTATNVGSLRFLKLREIHSPYNIHSRLEKSSNSLKTISFKLNIGSDPSFQELSDWDRFTTLSFSNLTTFSLSHGPAIFYVRKLPEILPCFPTLESLYLGSVIFYKRARDEEDRNYPNRLIRAITQILNLTRLGFYHFHVGTQLYGFFEGLLEYFANASQRELHRESHVKTTTGTNNKYGLKSLEFFQCNGFPPKALEYIANIRSLEHFIFVASFAGKNLETFPPLSSNDINTFTRASFVGIDAGLPFLSSLELGNIVLFDESIQNIIASKSLKSLVVDRVRGFTKTGKETLDNYLKKL